MRQGKGFTLIELMITVVIIGILATIAYPSFLTQLRKSRRAEAQSTLMGIAVRQQQFLLDARRYASSVSELGVTVPPSVAIFYAISILAVNSAGAEPTFIASAVPLNVQADDACAVLSVDQAGVKAPASCW